jgi:putative endonuclease
MKKLYYVYILTSRSRALYTGMNDLVRRIGEYRQGRVSGFTSTYRIYRLIHLESFRHVHSAVARETEIKCRTRAKRVALREASNRTWEDLAGPWFPPFPKQEKADAPLPLQMTNARGTISPREH